MKKLIALVPVFVIAACGGVDINLGENANAQTDCNGGTGGGGTTAGTGGSPQCGCEGPNSETDGARLKAQWVHGDDGSRMRKGYFWTDTGFQNETCTFQKLPNGETRCVPPHEVVNSYSDGNCFVPMYVQTNPCSTPPRFARIDDIDYSDAGTCGHAVKSSNLYYIGDEQPGFMKYFHKDGDGNCIGGSISSGGRVFLMKQAPQFDFFVLGKVD